ncbi:MAG: PilZ domain-containing protein [Ignavibacteriaceae bacterium]|jgi:hypothetical protein|nr:PilZ domain-containing protein [Ignavibacteriaceae bacterium]
MGVERRKFIRFLVQDNTFATLGSVFYKVGKVNDISIKGLSFSYLSENIEAGSNSDSSRVDIFLSKNNFYLTNVPCKIVYDIPNHISSKNHSVMMYRCGLYFGKLPKIQLKLLSIFIKKHATEVFS